MSLESINNILGHVNAWMGSAANAIDEKNKGVDTGTAIFNFGRHAMNGTIRNIAAHDIYERTGGDYWGGSYLGHIANAAAGYGTDEADKQGMKNMFGASMLSSMSPFGYSFGMSPFGYSTFGGGMYPMGYPGFAGGYMGMPMGGMMPMGPTSYTEINITTNGCHHRPHRSFLC